MATFAYRGTNSSGRRMKGSINAANRRQARDKLREMGLVVEHVRGKQEVRRRAGRRGETGNNHRAEPRSRVVSATRYRSQLTIAMRELATLLRVGVPLIDAIHSIIGDARGGFQTAMAEVRDRVTEGSSLAEAMDSQPRVFDEMTRGMVSVGEHAGNLDEVCLQIADFRERSGQLKDRVISALLYPIIVLLVSVAVTVFLMTVVVPMLLQNLIEIGRPLPLPTKFLKYSSDAILTHGGWLMLVVCVACIGSAMALRHPTIQLKVDRLVLRMPILGTLVQKQCLSRMTLVIGSLMRSGVELVDALQIAERASTNRILQSALSKLQTDLRGGRDLREAAEQHDIFTNAVAQVLSLGQQSGQLEIMLERLGEDYDRQSALLANRLTTVMEPVLIICLSAIVGFILLATVLPILEAGNVMST